MDLYKSKKYIDDLNNTLSDIERFSALSNSSILITGASGMIGSYMVDVLLRSCENGSGIKVIAMARDVEKMKKRFSAYKNSDNLVLVKHDLNEPLDLNLKVDYIIHAASNATPADFNADPVGTLMVNIMGTKMLLDYAKRIDCKRFLYVSSGEVYGVMPDSANSFLETDAGYVDSTSVRSCYPNGKRAAETLCVSYSHQHGVDTVIVRPSHVYGPTALQSDDRACSSFIRSGVDRQDIVLNSAGKNIRSYTYVADAVSALLSVLINGKKCEAYNISNSDSIVSIYEFAKIVSDYCDTQLHVAILNNNVLSTPITKQILNNGKIKDLGWNGSYSIAKGIALTIDILREANV